LTAAAVLALGSVAVAQPGLILDPWGASQARAERAGRFRVTQRAHTFQGTGALIVDPWGVSASDSANRVAERDRNGVGTSLTAWATAGEIVDPWASSRRPTAPAQLDALIVDPWKR
jgi:hypothetical protein